MPRGGARLGAGRPAKPLAVHVRAGTYRPARHGPLPANVLAMPAAAPSWAPSDADLAALGTAGRVFVDRMTVAYDFTLRDGLLLLEAGHVTSALAAVRGLSRAGKTLREVAAMERIELAWSKQLLALLAHLRVQL